MFNLCQGGIVDGGQLISGGLERRQHRLETAGRRVRSQLLADLQVRLEFSLIACTGRQVNLSQKTLAEFSCMRAVSRATSVNSLAATRPDFMFCETELSSIAFVRQLP